MSQDDLLTALATAAEMLRAGAKNKQVAADLERLMAEIQKSE
jgi:hypothetical protein